MTALQRHEKAMSELLKEIDKAHHKNSLNRLNGIDIHGQTSIFTDFE